MLTNRFSVIAVLVLHFYRYAHHFSLAFSFCVLLFLSLLSLTNSFSCFVRLRLPCAVYVNRWVVRCREREREFCLYLRRRWIFRVCKDSVQLHFCLVHTLFYDYSFIAGALCFFYHFMLFFFRFSCTFDHHTISLISTSIQRTIFFSPLDFDVFFFLLLVSSLLLLFRHSSQVHVCANM